MYAVRLNDIKIEVKKQDVFLLDVFGDISAEEINRIITYLELEGFVNPEKEKNVFIKTKPSTQPKKENKKKN